MAKKDNKLLSDKFWFSYAETVSQRLGWLCFAYTFLWWIAGCLILRNCWTGSVTNYAFCAWAIISTILSIFLPSEMAFDRVKTCNKDYALKWYLHDVMANFQVICAMIFWCNIVMVLTELAQLGTVTSDFLIVKIAGIFSVLGFILCPDPDDFFF